MPLLTVPTSTALLLAAILASCNRLASIMEATSYHLRQLLPASPERQRDTFQFLSLPYELQGQIIQTCLDDTFYEALEASTPSPTDRRVHRSEYRLFVLIHAYVTSAKNIREAMPHMYQLIHKLVKVHLAAIRRSLDSIDRSYDEGLKRKVVGQAQFSHQTFRREMQRRLGILRVHADRLVHTR